MKHLTHVVLFLFAVLFIAADTRGEKGKADKEKLQGTWIIVSADLDGKPLKEVIGTTLTVAGDGCEQGKKGDKEYYEGKFKLDESKNPKHIDLAHRFHKMMAIYAVDGDDLKLSYFVPPNIPKRPSEFVSKQGEKQMLMVMKRKK